MAELDDMFHEFADAFRGMARRPGREIAFPDRLDRSALDGSLESLEIVDRYLDFVHKNAERVTVAEIECTILWGGAYVGEVLRLLVDEGALRWVDYDEYMPRHPELRKVLPQRELTTAAFLVTRDDTMWMPLNKIHRYLADGAENSDRYFADVVLGRLPRN